MHCPNCGFEIPSETQNPTMCTACEPKGEVMPIIRSDMLFCPACSQHNIPATATHCPNCHTKFVTQHWICPTCKHSNLHRTMHCHFCKAPYSDITPGGSYYHGSKLGKKWFHFLIYFALFAHGGLNILSGLVELTNTPMTALFSIGIGVFYFFIRYFLANFKTYAPAVYLWTEGITTALSAISSWFELVILKETIYYTAENYSLSDSFANGIYVGTTAVFVISMALAAAVFICECIYFSKRAPWFNQK